MAHDRSLELFCDRFEVIARFLSLINDDPPPRRLLFLYGLGGNGKSLLLRYLAARCCVRLRPVEWERVRRQPGDQVRAALGGAAQAVTVPVARIDFGARPVGENRPQECFSALFMLKQQLARYRIATPRFDFAAVTYLHKLGFDLDRRLPELFPRGEIGLAFDVADALLPVQVMQVGQDLFGALDKRLDDVFTRRRVQRRLPKADAREILSLAPEPDLIYQLPRLFAADLAGAVGEKARHRRVVLLFDTHEAFFGEAIADPGALLHADYLMRDEWLRSLLGHLPLEAGVVAVVAGRTRPPWAAAPVAAIPDAFVEWSPVGHLATGDGLAYLEHAGVGDQVLRLALTRYASVGVGEVHPYFLGLCADVALAAGRRGGCLDPADVTSTKGNAGELRSLGGCHGFASACRGLVVAGVDVGGDAGDAAGRAGFAGGVLVPAAERGFDLAGTDAGPPGAVEVRQDGAADVAGQVTGGTGDVPGGGDQVLGGLDGDLIAGPVGVGAGHGLDGIGDRGPQRLVDGQQRPHLLLDAGGIPRAQHPALQQGVAQREVGDLVLPSFVIQRHQRARRVGAVVQQGRGQPVHAAVGGAVVAGDGHLGGDDADLDAAGQGGERPVGQVPEHQQAAGAGEPDQELRLRGGDRGEKVPAVKAAVDQHQHGLIQ